jgi:hypothetical protein
MFPVDRWWHAECTYLDVSAHGGGASLESGLFAEKTWS